ncbi:MULTISPECIES: hypothetical protein [unclassified Sphingobacterium]|uniref:hypothetical protein n=1 Tax=unclassified Sphingobacterium TaxID=2609468 RepID=UPI0028A91D45|nr:hypothetical protein [Sphingobacterium sp.]
MKRQKAINGQVEVGHQIIKPSQAVLFERDGSAIKIKATQASDFLVLGGEVYY